MREALPCLSICGLLFVAIVPSPCLSGTILPVADGSILYESATDRYMVYAEHWTTRLSADYEDESRGFIHFGVVGITGELRSATLALNVQNVDGGFEDLVSIYIFPGGGSISPRDFDATFSYGPFSNVQYLLTQVEMPPMPGPWVSGVFLEIDVLEAAQFAQDNAWEYLGFMLSVPPGHGGTGVYYGTLETPEEPQVEGVPPTFTYEYVPEPATLGLFALYGLGVLVSSRRRQIRRERRAARTK